MAAAACVHTVSHILPGVMLGALLKNKAKYVTPGCEGAIVSRSNETSKGKRASFVRYHLIQQCTRRRCQKQQKAE